MQFLVLAYDGTDPDHAQRRERARGPHLAAVAQLEARGQFLIGGAILDESGAMIGSAVIFEFPARDALDRYLATDPYVVGKVWQRIEVRPFRVAQLPTPQSPEGEQR
ncbi:MAG TPA: YciI family protein [Steroidobacteraceae bacterium]|nr:YciI family protein [Steroidobacteraceae bacterium]